MAVYKLNNKKNKSGHNAKKIVGFSLIGVASFVFLFLTGIVKPLQTFLLGIFGVFGFPLCLVLFIIGLALVNNKKYVMSIRYTITLVLSVVFLLCILHLAVVGNKFYMVEGVKTQYTFGQYLAKNYLDKWTPGGFLIGFLTSSFLYMTNLLGAYLIFALALAICVAIFIDSINHMRKQRLQDEPVSVLVKEKNEPAKEVEKLPPKQEQNIVLNGNIQEQQQKEQLSARQILGLDTKRNKAFEEPKQNVEPKKEEPPKSLKQLILTPPTIDIDEYFKDINKTPVAPQKEEIEKNVESLKEPAEPKKVFYEDEFRPDANPIIRRTLPEVKTEELVEEADDILKSAIEEEKQENPDVFEEVVDSETNLLNSLPQRNNSGVFERRSFDNENLERNNFNRDFSRSSIGENRGRIFDIHTPKPQEEEVEEPAEPYEYERPPLDFITTQSVDLSTLNEDVAEKRLMLENTLENFGIPAKVQGVVVGPAVTRYELEMPQGIAVSKIKNRADDIALSLAAEGAIRIEAPIPGKSVVGVEVPNSSIATVSLKDILASKEFTQSSSPLTFALGKDITGNIICANMQKLTHLLVAGSTGSGKSVCLNSIILSMIYKASPKDVRIVLIDPKRVEFSNYEALPHLIMPKIVCDTQKAISTLAWAVTEMERRFEILGFARVKNIDEYNQTDDVVQGKVEKMPFIVIIVDELADLMMTGKKEVEEKVCRLAQKSRAAGIHLILATQRPSVDVVTGLIKSNFPSRIAFAVTSAVDSMTILDRVGAEKLLGKGDSLYYPVGAQEPKRVQGCFISTNEINKIVDYVRDNNKPIFDKDIEDKIENPNSGNKNGPQINNDMDELLPVVLKMCIDCGQASITMIRRRFAIGYARAARIVDQMEEAGYVSTSDGVKGRTVYTTEEEFKEIFGDQYD